ncbi:MAG: hypothetical protein ACRD2Q_06535 [Terriglobales bacterium]
MCRPPGKLLAVAFTLLCCLPVVLAADVAVASSKAHNWLKSQMATTGLVDSYKDKADTCHTYDQAVAIVAFLARGDVINARRVLDALALMQNADGSWNSAYHCQTRASLASTRYVGSNAWVVVAIAHYEKRTADTVTYHIMGERAVNWLRLFQQADGGINGGLDASGVVLPWASTEHNQDAYPGLVHFAYPGDAGEVKSFLDNVVWEPTAPRWWQGRNDPADPLDVNPLGVSALGATGTRNYQLSLNYPMTHHRSTQTWGNGRNRVSVNGFDFNSDHNDIWLEGTAQMAKAFRIAGRTADADFFLQEIIKVQQASGGVPYSVKGTNNGDFVMSKAESVAATGWLILAIENINPLKP